MGLYERIREIAKNKGYSINRLEKELGFARSSISKFNKNKPGTDKIKQIADFLGVSTDYILSNENSVDGFITCPDCGFSYLSSYSLDVQEHQKEHRAWEKAVQKHGKLYCDYRENEEIKAINRNIRDDQTKPLNERVEAELEVLRCLFSRSLSACDFDPKHVSFERYVAMMMNNPKYKSHLDKEIVHRLVKMYGTETGINDGESYYHIPDYSEQTIAAHFDASEFTDEELEEIRQFAEFVKSKRN